MRRSFVWRESLGSVKVFRLDREPLIAALKKEAERIGRSAPNVLEELKTPLARTALERGIVL